VKRTLVSESYQQAVEKNSLQVLGEPDFDNPDAITLPEDGAMTYSFQVEVQPDITLPQLSGLKVKRPKIEVTDANVDQAMNNLREQQGTLVPVENRGVEARRLPDCRCAREGGRQVVTHQHDAQIVSRAGRVGGIQVDDLEKQLKGLKPGEKRDVKAKAPDTHPTEEIRGKDVEIEVALKDIKKLELAEMNADFCKASASRRKRI
jgi:trigger factor